MFDFKMASNSLWTFRSFKAGDIKSISCRSKIMRQHVINKLRFGEHQESLFSF